MILICLLIIGFILVSIVLSMFWSLPFLVQSADCSSVFVSCFLFLSLTLQWLTIIIFTTSGRASQHCNRLHPYSHHHHHLTGCALLQQQQHHGHQSSPPPTPNTVWFHLPLTDGQSAHRHHHSHPTSHLNSSVFLLLRLHFQPTTTTNNIPPQHPFEITTNLDHHSHTTMAQCTQQSFLTSMELHWTT